MNRSWLELAGYHLTGWQIVGLLAGVITATVVVMRVLRNWASTPGVRMATFGAVMCTVVSMNTSWRYFGTHLGITSTAVRTLSFATAEVVLFSLALLTREKYKATEGESGGPAAVLIWVISGIACVPAFAEGGVTGGFVRSFLGPLFAAALWHLAMGIELIHTRDGEEAVEPKGTVARLLKFIRESALATLGLAEPDRDAKEIRRDRAAAKAVRLADEYGEMEPEERKKRHGKKVARQLRDAVRVAEIGSDPVRRDRLMLELSATRNALKLATIDFPVPWAVPAVPLKLAVEALVRQSDPDTELAALLDGDAETLPAASRGYADTDTQTTGRGDGYTDAETVGGDGYAAAVPGRGDADTVHGYARVAPRGDTETVAGYAGRPWGGDAETAVSGGVSGPRHGAADTRTGSTVSLVNAQSPVSARITETPETPGVSVSGAVPAARRGDAETGRSAGVSATVPAYPAPRAETPADTQRANGYAPAVTMTATRTGLGYTSAEPLDGVSADNWTETRWSADTARAARKVVADWKAMGVKPTARAFGPALRAEKGKCASENLGALYRYAISPDEPSAEDLADDQEN